jgi:3'5'-cyclic nucleotide phosphodiesterase
LLFKAGKSHWVQDRDDSVDVKGKGIINTFWLSRDSKTVRLPIENNNVLCEESQQAHDHESNIEAVKKIKQTGILVDWICELVFLQMEKLVCIRRKSSSTKRKKLSRCGAAVSVKTPLDEVVEVIEIPKYIDLACERSHADPIEIDPIVKAQLKDYISVVASMYHDNPFHNFEHACHVTMSVNKLLTRIQTPDIEFHENSNRDSDLYDFTHGISSDPITLLAVIFSAVIHDVDHRGVSNSQLVKEEEVMARKYNCKSIAEQNSVDIAWRELSANSYKELRDFLFATEDDLLRFRQIFVNVVLATDIFDRELNDLRKLRWEKAFSTPDKSAITSCKCHSLRATIVIEHLIQASDVSHTMQHWHVYRKWNYNLFKEFYLAYQNGRMANNPADFWYQGELDFFDNYVIPLAKKLKDCCVFGVSSDEYLNYAEQNRAEWAARGNEILAEMLHDYPKVLHKIERCEF